MIKIEQTQLVETMKNIIKLLKVLFQLLILMIIIDRSMSQCGIRWRGTCNRKLVKKADDLQNFIDKGKGDDTSLIRYLPGLLLLPRYQENTIEKRAFQDDNRKDLKTSNAKRLW